MVNSGIFKNLEQLLKLEFCYCMSSGCEYLNFWLQYCHNILQTYSMCEVNVGFKVLDFIIHLLYSIIVYDIICVPY